MGSELTSCRCGGIKRLLEANLGAVFGIRFFASEFSTGNKTPGASRV